MEENEKMNLPNREALTERLLTYTREVCNDILKTDFGILTEIAEKMIIAKTDGKTIYIAGNGGSAATASHMANDLIKGCRVHNREGFRAICINDSTPVITCLANDFAYEDIYSIQLKTLAKSGDLFIVYSGSGNSPNIVKAVKVAKEIGMYTIGFSGSDGGRLNGLCDKLLIAPSDIMEQIEDMHMLYEHTLTCTIRKSLEELWGIEVRKYPAKDFPFKAALFDFDGTISLIREGWQDVMISYFTEVLASTPFAESKAEIIGAVTDFIGFLTGKQTIHQCIKLNEEVVKRGGAACNPLVYKKEYLRRLETRIKSRLQGLESKAIEPSEYLVSGCVELLQHLKEYGIKLYLASGTDEVDVLRESRLLDVEKYFDGGIYGAKDDVVDCSKEIVIKRILEEREVTGEQLIAFGDGYVEIDLVNRFGGYTVAVATDEVRKYGVNDWKRNRLIAADAAAIIPDFSNPLAILNFLKRGD